MGGDADGSFGAILPLDELDAREHRLRFALDVRLAVGNVAPNRPEQCHTPDHRDVARDVRGVVDKDELHHRVPRSVGGKASVPLNLELERLGECVHHLAARLGRPLSTL